jgi:hypothetical protein
MKLDLFYVIFGSSSYFDKRGDDYATPYTKSENIWDIVIDISVQDYQQYIVRCMISFTK